MRPRSPQTALEAIRDSIDTFGVSGGPVGDGHGGDDGRMAA